MSTQETKPEPRRPKLRLPFDNRREDAGEWAFDHRAGLCVTLIAYLLLAIAFVGAKIVVGGRPAAQGFYIDLQQLEQLAAEKERLEREVRRRQQQEPIDWKSIRNDVSNENAKLDESLRDDRGTNTAALNDAADAAQERMRANREAYERGLAEAEAIRQKGLAEAEAMKQKAEAYKQYNDAAVAEMMIKVLPEIAKSVAQPLSSIDKVSIIGGDASGVSGVSGNVPVLMAQTMEAMKEATGIDMKEIVRANSIQAKTDRNINVTGLEGLQPTPQPDPAPADAAPADPVTE